MHSNENLLLEDARVLYDNVNGVGLKTRCLPG